MQVVWYNIHVRGAGKNFHEANERAVRRLTLASRSIDNGQFPLDPGVRVATDDPGGGGGPCAPEYIKIEVNVSPSGLPEAESRDDD
jgi:hypothetical protein